MAEHQLDTSGFTPVAGHLAPDDYAQPTDIVTRLRAVHLDHDARSHRTHFDGCVESHPLCALAWALDEIERLRFAGDALAAAYEAQTQPQTDREWRITQAWEEARRD